MKQDNQNINLNNELMQDKFRLQFRKINLAEILCQTANVPGLSAGPIEMANPNNKIYLNSTKVDYEPFTMTFKIDENLETWKQIHDWIVAIHAPQAYQQFAKYHENAEIVLKRYQVSADASLFSLTNAMNPNIEVKFFNLFPIALSAIDYNLAVNEMLTATATFQYDYFLLDHKTNTF